MKKLTSTLIVTALVIAAVTQFTHAQRPADQASEVAQAVADGRAVGNEVLIQFRAGASAADEREARGWVNAQRKELLRSGAAGDLELATLPPGIAIANAIGVLVQHPAVAFVEPNWIYQHQADSNDTYFTNGSLWGMYGPGSTPANEYGSRAVEAWADGKTGGGTVVIGVIDEGIDFSHVDLAENIWTNPGEIAGNGVDDDGNGFVDDVRGWDFVNNDNSIYDGSSKRPSVDAHGTHVSGTIGGVGGNGTGVAGVSWNVKIVSAKFLGVNGGTTANAVKAVDYLTGLKKKGVNVVATNNSWGGGGYSQALHDAIIRGAKENILFIAAAGNSGQNNDTTASYPSNYSTLNGTATESAASYDAIVAVAALCGSSSSSYCTGGGGTLASFSSYGATTVDLAAPGVGIYSTTPSNGYSSYSGTSMATPHVTGAVALYVSANAGATAAQVKLALLTSVTPTGALGGKTTTGGRLNVCGMLGVSGCTTTSTTEKPAAPTNLQASASGADVTLTWNGSATATSYNVLRSTTSGGPYAQVGSTGNTSYTDTVPATGTYYYVVQAVNAGGPSGNSNQASTFAEVLAPAPPQNLTATAPRAKKQIALSWTGSSGATSYRIYRSTDGTNFTSIGSVTSTGATNTGLQSGVTYYYYVIAENSAGESSPSNTASATAR